MTIKVTLVGVDDVEVFFGDDVQVQRPGGMTTASSLQVDDTIIMHLAGEVTIASVEEV